MTNKEKILRRLKKGWVANYILNSTLGSDATRLVRRLRQQGHEVEMRRIKDKHGKFTNTYQYRIA